MGLSAASRFAELPEDQRNKILSGFSEQQLIDLKYDWSFWGRPEQIEPEGDWSTWLALAGRGWGKTEAGAQWVKKRVENGARSVALIAETQRDLEDVMVKRLLSIYPDGQAPSVTYKPVRVFWPNGATATGYNGTEPDQLRGPEFDTAWIDEFAKYRKAEETWDMLQMTLRVGDNPRTLITTTPRPIAILKKILAAESTVVSTGSTFDNAGNLSPRFLERIKADYDGTRLGRQELYAAILDDNPNALFHQSLINETRVDDQRLPDFNMTLVGVDPPATGNPDSDECGIVVASRDRPDTKHAHFYVQDDQSIQGRSPEGWAAQAISAYYKHEANAIVAEVNQGGDMVESVIKGVDPDVKVIKVRATKGKWIRAEPVAGLYEQKRVHHIGSFPTLEDQMCDFDPSGLSDGKSPDRMDALVWVITELSNRKLGEPGVRSL